MNSFDLSSIGPISSQTMTSDLIIAFFNRSAANLHPARLTKYFPTLGPFSVTEANTSLSFVEKYIQELLYTGATKITVSACPVGTNALIDGDDGQKEGSYDRLIGIVYCNDNATSLNQILLEERKGILYEDFCGVSEFTRDKWVTSFGC